MPDRMLREGICTSSKLGSVSERAEMLFTRLIVKACPLGRFHARPDIVKAQALTNRPRIRVTDVALALDELERAGLIVRYASPAPENEPLLAIPKYGQRFTQQVRSPFPPPPTGPGDAPGQRLLFADPSGPPAEVIHNPPPTSDFARPAPKERRKETSPQPPAAAGGDVAKAIEARKAGRQYRDSKRAAEELERVETELTDILHPGGSAWKVTPTGAKLDRYTVLMARRTELLRMVETEERRAS